MYAPHARRQHSCHRVLSVACPGFLTVPQGGMSAAAARNTLSQPLCQELYVLVFQWDGCFEEPNESGTHYNVGWQL